VHRLVLDPCRAERTNNLDIAFGTYLGSSETDDANIAGLQVVAATSGGVPLQVLAQGTGGLVTADPGQDGQHVLVAGNWGNIPSIGHAVQWPLQSPGYNTSSEVADGVGGPVAQVAKLSPTGRLYYVTRLGNSTMMDFDASAATGSSGNVYIALENQGVVALSSNGSDVAWRTCGRGAAHSSSGTTTGNVEPSADASSMACCPVGLPCRVSVSEDGTFVAVLSGKQARVYDAASGLEIARSAPAVLSGQSYVEDVAVSADAKKLFVAGFNNRFNGGIPV